MSRSSTNFFSNGVVRFIAECSSRQLIIFTALIACLMVLPTALESFTRDDFYHRAMLKGEAVFPGERADPALSAAEAAHSLFYFFGPDNDNLRNGREAGMVPWWVDERLEIRFWRPLAALTHWVDYQLWPDFPTAMHLHSILWYVLLVLVWGLCLRQFGYQGWALLLGLLAYGVDASHIGAVAWLANRNILIAATLGFLAIFCLHRSVLTQRFKWLIGANLLFAGSLFSAEGGIAVAAFLGSYALFMDRRSWRVRLLWMLPFVAILAGWRSLYTALGFSARHSGAYMDPGTQTPEFFANLLIQAPILLMDQFSMLESLQLYLAPATVVNQACIGVVAVSLVIATFWPLLRQSRPACYLLVGALLAAVPAGGTLFTGSRLLLFSGAGLMAVYGLFFAGLIGNSSWLPASRLYRVWAWALMLLLTAGNLLANGVIWGMVTADKLNAASKPDFNAMTDVIAPYNGEAAYLVVVNPPFSFDLLYVQLKAKHLGLVTPPAIRTLAPGVAPLVLTRVADNAVEILSEGDSLAISPKADFGPVKPLQSPYYSTRRADTFFAGNDFTMEAGQTIQLRDTVITVKEVNAAGVPRRVRFEFALDLGDARYQWLYWDMSKERFNNFTLPDIGKSIRIAGPFEP